MKKALFGITLIIGIGICLGLLFFPVLEFDREAIYEQHKEEIEQIIAVVRMGKSPTEQAKIEKMMRMIQMMSPKR